MANFDIKTFDELFDAVLKLKNVEDCRRFFEDVCTIKELQDISQRLEVARLLKEGNNYQEVCKQTGASTATICRVNKCILYGRGGYDIVFDKNAEENNNGQV